MLALITLHAWALEKHALMEKHTLMAISPGGVISGPVALAALLTLTVIGPDHLATLVSLCASKRGWEAFNIGTAWGVGHTLGIMTIVPILIISQAWFGTGATQELWEHFGNYVIGVMMVCCGMYFLIFQSKYFVQKEDGTYAAQACTCCQQSYVFETSREQEEGHTDDASSSTFDAGEPDPPCLPCERGEHHPGKKGKTLFCNSFGRPRPLALSTSSKGVESETTPLIMGSDKKSDVEKASSSSGQANFWARFFGNRGLESIVIGLLQGFCCPSGLQSMIILTHISKNFSAPATLFFALAFYVGSVVGSGLVTFFIAEFTQLGLGSFVSAKSVYIGCCAFTICLGITWIIMNATGILESME